MRNTCRIVLLASLAGCATTVSSYEVHYDRAEVSYVTAPVRADAAHEHETQDEAAAGTEPASDARPIQASAPRPERR